MGFADLCCRSEGDGRSVVGALASGEHRDGTRREDGGSLLDHHRGLRTDGLAVSESVGEPFANRASTRPPLPQNRSGRFGVIATVVPENGCKCDDVN
jgi:hypothetical protein